MRFHTLTSLAVCALASISSVSAAVDNATAVVDFSVTRGTPQQYGSGVLYGIPDTSIDTWQIPKTFYTEIGINHGRGGGSQVAGKGWMGGEADYEARIESAYQNYLHVRALGGRFFLLNSALWGADGLQTASDPFPGDNGDWASYDAFLVRVAADINRLGMTEGLIVELWNEADYNAGFWTGRTLDQFMDTWGWAYHRLRPLLPKEVLISGPAFATELQDGGPWPQWFEYAKTNGSIPDMYTWHVLFQPGGTGNDVQWSRSQLDGLLDKYGLPKKPASVNEYAIPETQNPGYSAYTISALERYDTWGLRANWAMGGALHDYLASLVGKPDNTNGGVYDPSSGGYWATGEWHLYKYYYQAQTGVRVASTRSTDGYFDVFSTWNSKKGKGALIAGTNGKTGTYQIQLKSLPKVGKKGSTAVRVVTKAYPWIGFREKVDADEIVVVADKVYTVTNGEALVQLVVTNATIGYSLDIYPA